MKRIKIVNGPLITPFRIVENGTLLIKNGRIIDVRQSVQAKAFLEV